MKLRVHPSALADLKQIKAYISDELHNPESALNIVRRIVQRYSMLVDFPYMGASLSSLIHIETDFRYLVCDTHIIFYKVNDGVVSIHRILSSRQDYVRILFK
jgi:plasmid stabilization system protein ParE